MSDLTNPNISRYHVLECLAKAGWRPSKMAYDTRLERNVTIKVIRLEKSADPQFLNRFEWEVNALVQLVFPIIINIFDYGEHDGCPLPSQVRNLQVGTDQVSIPQVSTILVSHRQVSIPQGGKFQVGARQISLPQDSPSRVCPG